jgi:hypothetical protein
MVVVALEQSASFKQVLANASRDISVDGNCVAGGLKQFQGIRAREWDLKREYEQQ